MYTVVYLASGIPVTPITPVGVVNVDGLRIGDVTYPLPHGYVLPTGKEFRAVCFEVNGHLILVILCDNESCVINMETQHVYQFEYYESDMVRNFMVSDGCLIGYDLRVEDADHPDMRVQVAKRITQLMDTCFVRQPVFTAPLAALGLT